MNPDDKMEEAQEVRHAGHVEFVERLIGIGGYAICKSYDGRWEPCYNGISAAHATTIAQALLQYAEAQKRADEIGTGAAKTDTKE